MKVSKFIKVDPNVMIQYIYDDGNLIVDPYSIVVNTKDNTNSYVGGESSSTVNTLLNNIFNIDVVTGKWGKINTDNYQFLQTKDYVSAMPQRHDTIKIHLPINYTFGNYIGAHIKVYAYDYNMKARYDLSNFYLDMSNITSLSTLDYTSPPLKYQDILWGKEITIDIPSLFSLSKQRDGNAAKENTINYNLTNGVGFSTTSPIFVEFSFITSKNTISGVTTYNLDAKREISIPQSPEFENLGVVVEHSTNGDFFEIYGTYNNSLFDFKNLILDSVALGHRYNVEYKVTIYEQNIRGKTLSFYVTTGFNEKIEYRPIIKYSTTTAIIDVEMNLIDIIDNSVIQRRSSYGMLQDEVSKYALRLMKINISEANKPKIYNIKNALGAGILSKNNNTIVSNNTIQLEPIKVPFPVLIDKSNVVCKSNSVRVGKDTFWGLGDCKIMLFPFDNVIKLIIASKIEDGKVEYLDLSSSGEIKLVFKSDKSSYDFPLYMEGGEVSLSIGAVVFKIGSSKINDLRKIYNSGYNTFYITTNTGSLTTSIYTGLFKIWDTIDNIGEVNVQQSITEDSIISDMVNTQETAVVTIRTVETTVINNQNNNI
jgi:hypothetical protein